MENEREASGRATTLLLSATAVVVCCGGPLLFGLLAPAGIGVEWDKDLE